jgi:hypothetical protein
MFYCDTCRDKRNWPDGFVKSRGPCELCGKQAACSDVPSGALPPGPQAKERTEKDA